MTARATARQRTSATRLPLILAIAFVLIGIEVLMLGASQGSMPNQFDFPLYNFFGLYQTLWGQNPWQATLILAEYPLMEAAYIDDTGLTTWRIYFFLPSVITHALAAYLVMPSIFGLQPDKKAETRLISGAAICLLITSSSYIKLAAHCSGATWLIDVLLRALQNPLYESAFFWREVWFGMANLFLVIQGLVAIGGFLLFLIVNRHRRKTAARADTTSRGRGRLAGSR